MPRVAPRPDCLRLLRLLADSRLHRGEALAQRLGCSRGTLSRLLRDATAIVPIIAVRGKGYRLAEPLDLIDPDALSTLLARSATPLRVDLLERCESTNTVLLERALNGASHASVVTCELQSAGRGRRGAGWVSVPGGSLAFSLLWRFPQGSNLLSGLSLAVAVGAVRALERFSGPLGVKWPNDLLLSGKKLGGVLIELSGEALGPTAAVIGVGINVRLPRAARRAIPVPVADLAEAGTPPARTVLLAHMLESLAAVLEVFERQGFEPFRKEWLARHAWQGQRVALSVAERRVAVGEAVGVASDGALLLRSSKGLQRFHAGELSLRRSPEPA